MSHPYSIFGKIDWVAYRHKKHPPGDILIKTWWALKSTYYKRVNEIAKTKFGKPKRNYKKLSDSRKKVVDSIFKKKYPHARMTKKLAGIKWPDRETLKESYNGYPSTTKSPTNSMDKRRCLTFFNNRKKYKPKWLHKCNRCGHKWDSKNKKPTTCADRKCRSKDLKKPRVKSVTSKRRRN